MEAQYSSKKVTRLTCAVLLIFNPRYCLVIHNNLVYISSAEMLYEREDHVITWREMVGNYHFGLRMGMLTLKKCVAAKTISILLIEYTVAQITDICWGVELTAEAAIMSAARHITCAVNGPYRQKATTQPFEHYPTLNCDCSNNYKLGVMKRCVSLELSFIEYICVRTSHISVI